MSIQSDVIGAIVGSAIQAIGSRYPIKAMGITFNVPNDQKYIELVVIQDNNRNETWGNEQRFSGDIRIILHWPIDGAGIYTPTDEIADIVSTIQKGSIVQRGAARLLITDNPRLLDHIEGDKDLLFPAIIPYQYFHAP